MEREKDIPSLLEEFRDRGAPEDQQVLTELLRTLQTMDGGALTEETLRRAAEGYGLKESFLKAIVSRMPSLRMDEAPNRLEICGTCKAGAALREYVENSWQVKSGGVSLKGKFRYQVTGCMKNCKAGPSVKWNGELYPRAEIALLEKLIGKPKE